MAENKPQLVHTARQMFETRLAKYNDPHNLEWDFEDVTDKWERHAFSAFRDLLDAESEIAALRAENTRLAAEVEQWKQNAYAHGEDAQRLAGELVDAQAEVERLKGEVFELQPLRLPGIARRIRALVTAKEPTT